MLLSIGVSALLFPITVAAIVMAKEGYRAQVIPDHTFPSSFHFVPKTKVNLLEIPLIILVTFIPIILLS